MRRKLGFVFVCLACVLSISTSAMAGGGFSRLLKGKVNGEKTPLIRNESDGGLIQETTHKRAFSPMASMERSERLKAVFRRRSSKALIVCFLGSISTGLLGAWSGILVGDQTNTYSPVDDPELYEKFERQLEKEKLAGKALGYSDIPVAAVTLTSCAAVGIFYKLEQRAKQKIETGVSHSLYQ